ncbi:TPA_asm: hypothetical protein GahPV1_gp20 [Geoglobus ahangari pleomorphic virus 1]|uniref:Uncharacterized protein n=2 Tax=root TaxID=1 RepID=A0A0F7IHJ7_9EURY|nr:hypothetical protein [Geoglobus ahangari]AKG92404.1 hypothetical protein GAH_00240 [Geoglobus ahangari]
MEGEEVIYSTKLEYVASSGETKTAEVRVTKDRIVIRRDNDVESLLPQYINAMRYRWDPKTGYLATAIGLFIFSGIFYFIPPDDSFILFEKVIKQLISVGLAIFGVLALIAWWHERRFILTLTSFGYFVKLKSKTEKPIRDLYEAIEKVRIERG